MTQPAQKPGRSSGVFRTPDDFRAALRERFGPFTFDFAADASNTLVPDRFFSETDDALRAGTWDRYTGLSGLGFLNPPFSKIAPWAEKCWQTAQAGGNLLFLVPAAVGSNWFSQFVHHKAEVLFLNGRLGFMPDKPRWLYPKDLILACYGPKFTASIEDRDGVHTLPWYDVWRWKGKAL